MKFLFLFLTFYLSLFLVGKDIATDESIEEFVRLQNFPIIAKNLSVVMNELVLNIFQEDLPGVEKWEKEKVKLYQDKKRLLQKYYPLFRPIFDKHFQDSKKLAYLIECSV